MNDHGGNLGKTLEWLKISIEIIVSPHPRGKGMPGEI
jgi:hypothetical protein